MASRLLRLGTRRSALARAQSAQVARRLEQLHPGLTVELVGIDTRGDRILDKPLSKIEGKEFFTAEIDAALLRNEVDFTVHSYKDLSLDRPPELVQAAIPRRENPRDIVLFAADVPERLRAGEVLRIGTSSPRRAAFLPEFLRRALPGGGARVELAELRGNVDSRLRRLREPRGSERQLDGVVLALAGLSRLWLDEASGRALLTELLAGLPRMVVPLTACPAAPAQGALGIECRANDAEVRALLAALDDAPTRRAVAAERMMLAARGGGCHQQFGATQLHVPGLGDLLRWREAGAGEASQLTWAPESPLPLVGVVRAAWDGSEAAAPVPQPLADAPRRTAAALAEARAAFITHRHALPAYDSALDAVAVNRCAHLWVPGTRTWFELARRGVWIEGCAEGLGFDTLGDTLAVPLLQLPSLSEWLVLTHEAAVAGWSGCRALATYRSDGGEEGPTAEVSHVFWHSAAQFARWQAVTGTDVQHACAAGRTAERLRAAGVARLTVFPSVNEWRQWLRQ